MRGRTWRAGVAALVIVVASGAGTAARSAVPACAGGYAYAGVTGWEAAGGVAATLSAVHSPSVASGHIAAWVGVGGRGLGAGGSDEWIQAGISGTPATQPAVYVEVAVPGAAPAYTEVATAVPGRKYRVAVVQTAPERWTAIVDGRRVAPAVRLPGSRSWRPVATAESWLPTAAACNVFAYRFDEVDARVGSHWRPLTHVAVLDAAHYGVTRRGASFVVTLR